MSKTELPLHTNKVMALQKEKRKKISQKSEQAITSGDLQSVIDSLSDRQRKFCEEYLVDLVATQAVIRAGYQTKYPNRVAFQLMENPAIRITIDALRAERSKGTDVTKDFVLQKLQKILRKAEEDNNLSAAIRTLELLGRHLSLFVDRQEISDPDGEAIQVQQQKVKEEADSFVDLIDRTAKKMHLKSVE